MENRGVLDVAQRELEPNEEIVWTGQPDPRRFSKMGVPAALFGVVWTIFSATFLAVFLLSPNKGPAIGFVVMPISFVLVGLVMLMSPFFYYRKALATVYAITNQRVLWIHTGSARPVESLRNIDLAVVTMTALPNGSGNLMFGQSARQSGAPGPNVSPGFIGIENVGEVERLLNETFGGV